MNYKFPEMVVLLAVPLAGSAHHRTYLIVAGLVIFAATATGNTRESTTYATRRVDLTLVGAAPATVKFRETAPCSPKEWSATFTPGAPQSMDLCIVFAGGGVENPQGQIWYENRWASIAAFCAGMGVTRTKCYFMTPKNRPADGTIVPIVITYDGATRARVEFRENHPPKSACKSKTWAEDVGPSPTIQVFDYCFVSADLNFYLFEYRSPSGGLWQRAPTPNSPIGILDIDSRRIPSTPPGTPNPTPPQPVLCARLTWEGGIAGSCNGTGNKWYVESLSPHHVSGVVRQTMVSGVNPPQTSDIPFSLERQGVNGDKSFVGCSEYATVPYRTTASYDLKSCH
jgi:hypothetical protein